MIITLAEWMKKRGYKRSYITRLARQGRLPTAFKSGGTWLIDSNTDYYVKPYNYSKKQE